MRISAWMYVGQQMLCTLSLMLALGASAGLGPPSAWRMLLFMALGGGLSLLGAMSQSAFVRLAGMIPVALFPKAAWTNMPGRVWRSMLGTMALLSLILTGAARLLGSFIPAGVSVSMACLMVAVLPHLHKRRTEVTCVTVKITYALASQTVTALIDSGNLLRDGVTGLPVIVLSRSAARKLTPLPPKGQLLRGTRYLPIKTAAGHAMMILFRPDSVVVSYEGCQHLVKAMIGVSPEAEAGFTALAPSCVLRETSESMMNHIGG